MPDTNEPGLSKEETMELVKGIIQAAARLKWQVLITENKELNEVAGICVGPAEYINWLEEHLPIKYVVTKPN